jgi:hypothetical protein
MLIATASPARTALKNSQLTCGERYAYLGDRTLGCTYGKRTQVRENSSPWHH